MKPKATVSGKSLLYAFAALLFFWWLLSLTLHTRAIPSPWASFRLFFAHALSPLGPHLLVSLLRILASLALSLLFAVPLGIATGYHKALDRLFSPVIYLLYPFPKIVLLPLLLILFGVGDLSKILLIASIVFFQILVVTRDTAKETSPLLLDSIRSLGARPKDIYLHVLLPSCLPKIISCLRISLGTALALLFLAETYATHFGIGYYIMDALTRFDYEDVFAGIIALCLLGFFLFLLLDFFERLLCPWLYKTPS